MYVRTNNVRSLKFIIKLGSCSKYRSILCNCVLVVAHVTVSLWGSLSRTLGLYIRLIRNDLCFICLFLMYIWLFLTRLKK